MVIKIDQDYFEILRDDQNAFDETSFISRYSEILDKYDFIVGDYGYEQLRLKGFYHDSNKKSDANKRFSSIQDYILEYCNFGCKYFVLRRLSKSEIAKMTSEDVAYVDEENKLENVKIEPTIQQNSKSEIEEPKPVKNTLKDYL